GVGCAGTESRSERASVRSHRAARSSKVRCAKGVHEERPLHDAMRQPCGTGVAGAGVPSRAGKRGSRPCGSEGCPRGW
ncbi:hypothetical protein DKP78_18805, partial [Enterococcus faecium]